MESPFLSLSSKSTIMKKIIIGGLLALFFSACHYTTPSPMASEILGNPNYQAISYSGYRHTTRDSVPTIEEIKEDLLLLAALDIKLIRTYDTQSPQTLRILQAIDALKKENSHFEMYVMLGAWIDCLNARTDSAIHHMEDKVANAKEINLAIEMTQSYPDIVKVIAVGNEAMVHWATSYFVTPDIILGWVNHLQQLKEAGALPKDLWITSSDNFASWGGGSADYHNAALEALIKAVDFVSLHTYPFHDTHYNPSFWLHPSQHAPQTSNPDLFIVYCQEAIQKSILYAQNQYQATADYVHQIDSAKPIHIGETGWASHDAHLYGPEGSKAADEIKAALYHKAMRQWTNRKGITCFYFEAFDEPWKDAMHPLNSENHFGLFTVDGKAKYVLWEEVDKGTFNGLTRNNAPIEKTFNGQDSLLYAPVITNK